MPNKKNIALGILLDGIHQWGQSEDERQEAWQTAYDFMGFSVTLSVIDHEGKRALSFEGDDAERAKAFMTEIMEQFPLGKLEREVKMIEGCLEKYQKV